jgi:hypothetical protein
MDMVLRPNGRAKNGGFNSFTVELPGRALAVIDKVDGKGWELTIRPGSARILPRGLFGSPQDVLCVLEAEYSPHSGDTTAARPQAGVASAAGA